MSDSEIGEIQRRMNQAMIAAVRVASELAGVAIQLRTRQLQEAARRGEQAAHAARERMRAWHTADAATWREAMRPGWWRAAGAEDIATVWRAASSWQHVDPRAAAARRMVAEQLAQRGVTIDPADGDIPADVGWLSDALDRAVVDRAAGPVDEDLTGAPVESSSTDTARHDTTRHGTARHEARAARQAEVARRQEEMAGHVRAAWLAERAERVISSDAWPVLAYKLGQLDRAGHDVQAMLRAVPGFVDRAHTPAAYTYRVMDDASADLAGEAAADGRAAAAAARADERDQRTIDAEWREQAGAADAPGHERGAHADQARAAAAYSTAERDADRADGREQRAAQLAAQAFPERTATAVTEAATTTGAGATGRGPAGSGRDATRPPAQRRGAGRSLPREPGR